MVKLNSVEFSIYFQGLNYYEYKRSKYFIMAKKELIFRDLIDLLKEIDSPKNLPSDLFNELINAALSVGLTKLKESNKLSEKQAFEELEKIVTDHLQAIKKTL